MEYRINQVSNELEFNLSNISSQSIISHNGLPVVGEVNQHDIIELNVSLAKDADELNSDLDILVDQLISTVHHLGGEIYSGSSLIEDVSQREPARYRSTSLSESLARGLLDITSQQIVIGVQGEDFGVALFNYLRNINPVIMALSNSSPYMVNGVEILDTSLQSRRIASYSNFTSFCPTSMLQSQPLQSKSHYNALLQDISGSVLDYLRNGKLDANMDELCKPREGVAYYPFDCLEPHQIYWMTRFRPDHKNDKSDFSIELRASDIPITRREMKTINSFVLGLCYYCEDHGFDLPGIKGEEIPNMELAASYGPDAILEAKSLRSHIRGMLPYSVKGLYRRGCDHSQMKYGVERILEEGNSAERLRLKDFTSASQLRNYLAWELEQ